MNDQYLYYILYPKDDENCYEIRYEYNDTDVKEYARKLAIDNNIDYLSLRIIKENPNGMLNYVKWTN